MITLSTSWGRGRGWVVVGVGFGVAVGVGVVVRINEHNRPTIRGRVLVAATGDNIEKIVARSSRTVHNGRINVYKNKNNFIYCLF